MAPQLIWLGLFAASFFFIVFSKEREVHGLGVSIFSQSIMWTIFWWGGIFETINWADIVLILWTGLSLGVVMSDEENWGKKKSLSFATKFVALAIAPARVAVLYYSGFLDPLVNLFQ